jgi:ATP-binding cassette subfamily G (WHITE) protein 2 (PDR)
MASSPTLPPEQSSSLNTTPSHSDAEITSSDDNDGDAIRRITSSGTTSSTGRDRPLTSIRVGDRAELKRIASSIRSPRENAEGAGLSRVDTIAAIHMGDPELDPGDERFDAYKWARV